MTACGFNTALLHGVDDKNPFGTTQVPIYQSSAFRHECAEDLEKIFTNKALGFSYTRINNPTVEAFEKRVTMLEGGIGSVACACHIIIRQADTRLHCLQMQMCIYLTV